MNKYPEFASRLKSALEKKEKKPADLIHSTGLKRSRVYKWVYGESMPSGDVLIQICRTLDVSPIWLVEGGEPEPFVKPNPLTPYQRQLLEKYSELSESKQEFIISMIFNLKKLP